MYKYFLILLLSGAGLSCKKNNIQNKIKEKDIVTVVEPVLNPKNAEIVFCLDATGSMSGLISTAKEKIWDIVSELSQSTEIDSLKLGMVFYRDRGDSFITKQLELTPDLDEIYTELLKITAQGGGDTPESVNQALQEAVNEPEWSTNDNTYRTIFVVGDCPPHMDYEDDIKYMVSCARAAEKGITINTIKLGESCQEAIRHFKKMSECTNGEYLKLDQNAQDVVVETPYDDEINKISMDIDDSKIYYGDEKERTTSYLKKEKSMELYHNASKSANSARATYKVSKTGKKSWTENKEIVQDFVEGKLKLDSIKDDELPNELREKTLKEKKDYIQKLRNERELKESKLIELTKKRQQYIKGKLKEKKGDSLSFSKEVIKVMREQSKGKDKRY